MSKLTQGHIVEKNVWVFMVASMVLAGFGIFPIPVFAQADNLGYGALGTGSFYDTYTPASGNYFDTYTPSSGNNYDTYTPATGSYLDTYTPSAGSYNDTYTPPSGNYYDTYTPSSGNYYDTYTPATGNYYDTYTPSSGNYYDTYTPSAGNGIASTPTYTYTPTGYSLGYTNPVSGYSVGVVPTSGYSIGYTNPMAGNSQQQQQSQGQSQSSTNNNTNTNANTVTSTNTNNNNSSASASTGPISINNVNNNVVNVPGPQVISAPQQPHYPAPSCSMTVTRQGVLAGYYANQPMTLTWNSSNGTSAYISPSVGTVAPSGTTTIYPNGYTSYTMTVYGPGGTGTCYANAYGYSAPVSYVSHPVYTAPVVTSPSVSLNQIPYTGYDFGTVGDSIYWSVLFLFAAAAGYLMVYYQGGMLELATAMVRGNTNYSVVAEEDEEEAEEVNDIESEDSYTVPTIGDLSRMTTDAMIMQRGTNNEAPRIVIARA